jgi:hypothetical protein
MLPEQAQKPILDLLRNYISVRIGFGAQDDPAKIKRDAARSVDLLNDLWREAMAISEPRSLPANRFIESLDEMTKIQERRLTAYREHIPRAVVVVLFIVAMEALGFTGYQAGLSGDTFRAAHLTLAATLAIVTVLVIDLDQPSRGLIKVPTDALVEVAKTIQPLGLPPVSRTAEEKPL